MNLEEIFEDVDSRRSVIANSGTWAVSTGSTQGLTFNNAFLSGNTVQVTQRKKLFGLPWGVKRFEMSIEDFFGTLKKSKNQVKIIEGMVDKYLKSIEKAEKFGQVALVEKLRDGVEVVRKEALALAAGVKEYITDEQFENLKKKSSKHIEITYIKNFARPIPDELLSLKEKLDTDKVFEEYLVVHYDPKKKNSELTKKEVERKRDPILFGVMKGSRNLYYLGDWIDEYCNLTLKDAVAIIESETKKIS